MEEATLKTASRDSNMPARSVSSTYDDSDSDSQSSSESIFEKSEDTEQTTRTKQDQSATSQTKAKVKGALALVRSSVKLSRIRPTLPTPNAPKSASQSSINEEEEEEEDLDEIQKRSGSEGYEEPVTSHDLDSVEAFQREIDAIETFLKAHHELRDVGAPQSLLSGTMLSTQTQDYHRYFRTHVCSPNAIQASFLYSLRTDDVDLADLLLRDVGIKYLLRYCFLLSDNAYFSMDEDDLDETTEPRKHDDRSEFSTSPRNMFWIAAYYGSSQVLDILAEECLACFAEKSAEALKNTVSIPSPVTRRSSISLHPMQEDKVLRDASEMLLKILDEPTPNGSTPLQIASIRGNPDAVTVLLRYGVNPNSINKFGTTPSIMAAAFNHVTTLQALGMSMLVDMNKSNDIGMTPVLAACHRGSLEALKFLSQYRGGGDDLVVDFKVCDQRGYGCTAIAALYNKHNIIPFLAQIQSPQNENSPNINQRFIHPKISNHVNNGDTALHIAARKNHPECIQALVESRTGMCEVTARNMQSLTVLHIASIENHPDVVRCLLQVLDKGTIAMLDSGDLSGMTPLYYASMMGNLKIVQLLAPHSDVNAICRMPNLKKKFAASGGGVGVGGVGVGGVGVGGGDSPKISNDGHPTNAQMFKYNPPLFVATLNNHVEIVTVLITCGADVNQTDDAGHTAISIAAKLGFFHMVEVLLMHGADLKIRSKRGGGTPLQKARKYKHSKIVALLEKHGG